MDGHSKVGNASKVYRDRKGVHATDFQQHDISYSDNVHFPVSPVQQNLQ